MSLKCLGITVWILIILVSNAALILYLWYRYSSTNALASDYLITGLGPQKESIREHYDTGGRFPPKPVSASNLAREIELDAAIGSISGSYKLVRVTPTYRNYLESFGTPTQLAKVIMLSDEKIAIVDHGNSSFSFETVSEFKTSRLEFDLGVRFTTPFGRRGRVLDNIAFRTQPNVLFFRSHQPDHGWNITSKMIFTSKGMVNVKQFLNSNVTAKKYYKRHGTDPSEKFSGKELIETRNVLVVEDDFI